MSCTDQPSPDRQWITIPSRTRRVGDVVEAREVRLSDGARGAVEHQGVAAELEAVDAVVAVAAGDLAADQV